jgi:hypothetical protein
LVRPLLAEVDVGMLRKRTRDLCDSFEIEAYKGLVTMVRDQKLFSDGTHPTIRATALSMTLVIWVSY